MVRNFFSLNLCPFIPWSFSPLLIDKQLPNHPYGFKFKISKDPLFNWGYKWTVNADTYTSPRLDMEKSLVIWFPVELGKRPGNLIPRSKMTWNKLAKQSWARLIPCSRRTYLWNLSNIPVTLLSKVCQNLVDISKKH